jgi:hypothetical protein
MGAITLSRVLLAGEQVGALTLDPTTATLFATARPYEPLEPYEDGYVANNQDEEEEDEEEENDEEYARAHRDDDRLIDLHLDSSATQQNRTCGESRSQLIYLIALDAQSGQPSTNITMSGARAMHRMCVDTQLKRLFFSDGRKTVTVLDYSLRRVASFGLDPKLCHEIIGMELDQSSHRLFISDMELARVVAFDTNTLRPLFSVGQRLCGYSPLIGSFHYILNIAVVRDFVSNKRVLLLQDQEGDPLLAYSLDGEYLGSYTMDPHGDKAVIQSGTSDQLLLHFHLGSMRSAAEFRLCITSKPLLSCAAEQPQISSLVSSSSTASAAADAAHELLPGAMPWHRCRILLVGDGGVGKTILRHALVDSNAELNAGHAAAGVPTDGIEVEDMSINITPAEAKPTFVRCALWDFAGLLLHTVQLQQRRRSNCVTDPRTCPVPSFTLFYPCFTLFSGQSVYDSSHPIFLASECIFLLCFQTRQLPAVESKEQFMVRTRLITGFSRSSVMRPAPPCC